MNPSIDPQQFFLLLAMALHGAAHGPAEIPDGLRGSFIADPATPAIHAEIKIAAGSISSASLKCFPTSFSASGLRSQGSFTCQSTSEGSKPYTAKLRLRMLSDGKLHILGLGGSENGSQYLPASAAKGSVSK